MFLRIFKHLLPRAKAWQMTVDKQLKEFFSGLTSLGDDIKTFYDEIWLDIFPETTREIDKWESQFGLPSTFLTEQERRDRLDAAWKAQGGQDPTYLQATLQAAGFDVYIHEFWDLPRTTPPTVRNPLTYLNDGTGDVQYTTNSGALIANCGNPDANCGTSIGPTGFALVNKVFVQSAVNISCGNIQANCGASEMNCGAQKISYDEKQYVVPADPTKWPFFLYIGGQTFPEHATIPATRKNEFESLCLKYCPAQQWLGMLIDYA